MVEQVKLSIILTDDSVVVMSFITEDYSGISREASEENINLEIAKAGFSVKSWRFIKDEELIEDRTYRNAWRDTGEKLHVHMPSARELHKNYLRKARVGLLSDLDTEYLKADERGDQFAKIDISKRKQTLRDITKHPGIEAAETPEELKKIWF